MPPRPSHSSIMDASPRKAAPEPQKESERRWGSGRRRRHLLSACVDTSTGPASTPVGGRKGGGAEWGKWKLGRGRRRGGRSFNGWRRQCAIATPSTVRNREKKCPIRGQGHRPSKSHGGGGGGRDTGARSPDGWRHQSAIATPSTVKIREKRNVQSGATDPP